MPRQARKESGTGIYHVMLRGINRQDIFEDAEDYMRMLRCMQQMLEQYDDQGNRLPPLCTFYAYCLMSNHVHLLLRVNQENIGSTIIIVIHQNTLTLNAALERGLKAEGRRKKK